MPIIVNASKPIIDHQNLLESAKSWMADAIEAYLDGVHRHVIAFAPIGLEHLGKALLANRHPSLLVQLDRQHQTSLIVLAGHGTATDKAKLRTIGLREVLSRAASVIGDSGVKSTSISTVVDSRNGAIHTGDSDLDSIEMLSSVLRLNDWLLTKLPYSSVEFYGENLETVKTLLDRRASDIEKGVETAKRAAELHYRRLREMITDEEALIDFEAKLQYQGEPEFDVIEDGIYFETKACPVCYSTGHIWGPYDVDSEVDVEPGDEGEAVYNAFWVIHWTPDNFKCNVCKLALPSAEALKFIGVESPQLLNQNQVDFDPAEAVRASAEPIEDF